MPDPLADWAINVLAADDHRTGTLWLLGRNGLQAEDSGRRIGFTLQIAD
ncbi:hypothetical protein [Nocardia wallacei]|nr:hypothetical protein [Nocardia wallacei]